MDRERRGGGGGMRDPDKRRGLGVTRQTQFGVAVVKSINYFLIVVFEWTSGDWYEHVNMYVCVCACVHARVHACAHACVCVLCIYS